MRHTHAVTPVKAAQWGNITPPHYTWFEVVQVRLLFATSVFPTGQFTHHCLETDDAWKEEKKKKKTKRTDREVRIYCCEAAFLERRNTQQKGRQWRISCCNAAFWQQGKMEEEYNREEKRIIITWNSKAWHQRITRGTQGRSKEESEGSPFVTPHFDNKGEWKKSNREWDLL